MFRNVHASAQRGGALIVAIFIIVVMSVLGIALVSVVRDANEGIVTEVFGARAYNAAASGVEIFMAEQLFPVGGTPACAAQTYNFSAPGLESCSATVNCSSYTLPAPYSGTQYQVESTGACIIGGERYSRRLAVEAKAIDE